VTWENLSVFQLREFGRYLAWAEHHAMNEYTRADDANNKVCWSHELKILSETQVHVRELEHKYKMEAA
jgi:hypothetical protein